MEQNPLQSDGPDGLPVKSTTLITFSRRGRRGNPKAAQQRLEILRKTLNPIPFVPAKNPNLQRHQELLKRLGLWDFLHIQFDPTVRADLIAELIVNYSPQRRCSYVGEVRIRVSPADLGRALKLPVGVKSKKSVVAEAPAAAAAASEESIALVEDLVGNWVFVQEDEMPREVLKDIKEGEFGNVDWAGLIWFMVEKELLKGLQLGDCYYASHLQLLIKSQCESLFSEKGQGSRVEIELKEDGIMGGEDDFQGGRLEEHGIKLCLGEENVEKCYVEQDNVEKVYVEQDNVEKVDDEQENVEKFNNEQEHDVERENVEELDVEQENVEEVDVEQENENVEKFNIEQENVEELDVEQEHVEELDVEQENVEKVIGERVLVEVEDEDEDVMDVEEFKEEEPTQWLLAGKGNLRGPCLQRCNLHGAEDLGCGDERKNYMELGEEEDDDDDEEEEEDDQEGGFDLSMKGFSLEGLSSGSLMQVMEGGHIPLGSGMPLHDHLATDFPSSRWDLMLPGSSSLSGNGHKREFSHENDNSHHGLDGNKRLRTDGPWHSKMPGDFDVCMEHIQQWMGKMEDIQHWMGKARIMYAAKEQECEDAKMKQQLLLVELQKRDEFIDQLHKARTEDQQKRQTEKYRFEHEVYLMQNLLNGYRKALKATQKAFAEYKARSPQADEPLYRDVPGSGGLVLSTRELEKLRLKQEEEERMRCLVIETKIKDFEAGWISKFEAHHKSVEVVSNRLLGLEKEVKLLNEQLTKQRLSETPEHSK
ncbi:hypothetical protein RchiOBHm_Chr5g0053351 [Rosa chinensis]|uniref:Uncharacterized protein n=1 Tax=Rosa chinensis TaxID=74649 RepID=A0A2P6QFV6_ROSCH|nr:hypothetical protein RchiOBHm_Chr5g0053351 [Rosa chinensis]